MTPGILAPIPKPIASTSGTVIGPVVNLVSRLESLSLDLDPPIVVSESLARASRRDFREVGRFALKGIPEEQTVLTPEREES